MKISTRGRYSLRFMIDLAEHYNEGFIALKDIAARQNISKKYLEQIIPFLNRSGLLASNKGHMGGYMLAKAPSAITVREKFNFLEIQIVNRLFFLRKFSFITQERMSHPFADYSFVIYKRFINIVFSCNTFG